MANNVSTIDGAIQKYLRAEFMNRTQEDYETPLANPADGVPGTIPKNMGQAVQFRYFDHFAVETESGNDSPKQFTPEEEPASGKTLTATTTIVPLAETVAKISLPNWSIKTDLSNLMTVTTKNMMTLIRRTQHQLVNDSMVRGITALPNNSDGPPYGFGSLPQPFPTIYAGGGDFSDLTEGSLHTMDTWLRAKSALQNSGVQTFTDGTYHACISHGVKEQLMKDDANFRDIIKRIESLSKEAFQRGTLPIYNGITWKLQHDSYKSDLPASGGVLATRKNSGRVDVGHLYAPDSFGYAAMGSHNILVPRFKTQDITVTGTVTTVGFRIPFRALVFNTNRGVNVAGTTNFYETIANIAA